MTKLALYGLTKRFGEVAAVDGVDLAIEPGEFVSLLGPSGCGKTTTLRMIAGFIDPSEGLIEMDGQVLSSPTGSLPPERRGMSMIFQSYAVWPNMTVAENVAFGLRLRRLSNEEVRRRVGEMLDVVQMRHLAERYPAELSGGQQQRVALARAIVIEPRVLLCDEPLGALDKKLRQQMQFELKQLQKTLGLTLVFVTHDQEEALAMSDRIAVMNCGRVEQIGTPVEIYDRPLTRFVADFIGDTNIFRGERITTDVGPALAVGRGLVVTLPARAPGTGVLSVALRPEKIGLSPGKAGAVATGSRARGMVESTNFLGGAVLYRIALDSGHRVLAQQPNAGAGDVFVPGQTVRLDWKPADLVVLKD